jgi:PAS domain S-box-containing protein
MGVSFYTEGFVVIMLQMPSSSISILVVDDEPDLCILSKEFLEISGEMKVETAISVLDARMMLAKKRFDAIVSDYKMPVEDGIQFLKSLRGEKDDIPFILFTGKGREEVVIEALNNGANSYLQKGGNPRSLYAELEHRLIAAVKGNQAERELLEREEQYRDLVENINDIIFEIDEKGAFTYVSPVIQKILGSRPEDVVGKTFMDILILGEGESIDNWKMDLVQGHDHPIDCRVRTSDGGTRWMRVQTRQKVEHGAFIGARGSLVDISEHKDAEEKLRRLNRNLIAISECNQALIRANDEQNLLNDICKIICDVAGYRMAWIGIVEQDEAKSVRPVAWGGSEQGYLSNIVISWADNEQGSDPTGTAVRSGRSVLIQDLSGDVSIKPWLEEASKRNFHSIIAIPLKDADDVFGAMMIYSEMIDGFDEEDIALLEQMAMDLSFGIVGLREREKRKRAEEALKEERDRLSSLITSINDEVWFADIHGKFTLTNRSAVQEFNLTPSANEIDVQELASSLEVYRPDGSLRPVGEAPPLLALKGEVVKNQEEIVKTPKTGELRHRQVSAAPVRDAEGRIVGSVSVVRDITEHKKKDLELLSAQLDLKDVYHLAHIGTWDWQIEKDKVTWSEELYNIAGRDPLIPAPTYEEHPHQYSLTSWEMLDRAVKGALANGEPYNLDLEMIRPDGSIRYTNAIGNVKRCEDGKIIGLHGIVYDITERKTAEMELERTKALLEAINDQMPVGITIIEPPNGGITYQNKEVERLFRHDLLPTESIDEYEKRQVFHFDRKPLKVGENVIARSLNEGIIIKDKVEKILRGDGSYGYLSTTSTPILDKNGKVIAAVAMNIDVTNGVRSEKDLHESEKKYRTLFESNADAVFLIDQETWDILDANPAASRVYGFDHEDLVRMNMNDIFAEPERTANVKERPRSQMPMRNHRRNDGSVFPVDIKLRQIVLQGKNIIIATSRDITDKMNVQVRLESLVAKRTEELIKSNENLEQFAYIASHDLQEPLRMISSFLQLFELKYKEKIDDEADLYISQATDGAKRLQQMINDLLTFSRIGTTGKDLVLMDLGDSLKMALQNTSIAIRDSGATIVKEDLPMVLGEEGQMTQVFQNLIANSIKFRKREVPVVIKIGSRLKEGRWEIFVSDNGIGIAPEFSERIFRLFQRLHARNVYEGTGIGLALCKRIIERHGGSIWVEGQEGTGSDFIFTLPVFIEKGEN